MSDNNLKSALEALLFASDKPLTIEQIKNALDTKETEQLRVVIQGLKSEYESTNRGMRITEIANGYQMVTSTNFASFLKKLYKERHVERLTRPALETLAIIAYKQPLTKHEIESLRNVNVDGVVKNLLEKDLIRVSGRKKAPGRPLVFATTRQFLEYFGLKSLEELPKMEDFSKLLDNQENINEPKEPAPKN